MPLQPLHRAVCLRKALCSIPGNLPLDECRDECGGIGSMLDVSNKTLTFKSYNMTLLKYCSYCGRFVMLKFRWGNLECI